MKPAAVIFVALALTMVCGPALGGIEVYANAPSPLRHAANELSKYTGIPVGTSESGALRLTLNEVPNPELGNQGYTIRSHDDAITISANDGEGVANGLRGYRAAVSRTMVRAASG